MTVAERTRPRGPQRVLTGYVVTLGAVLCGLPALIIGWFAASRCSAEGFTCLGYLIAGLFGVGLIAAIALPLLARRFRLGLWFSLLTIALVAAPLWLADGHPLGGAAFLAPGLAAWISEPTELDPAERNPLAPAPEPPDPLRHWGVRIGAALLLSVILPVVGRVI